MSTHLPVSSTTVASMNSVDLSFTMTWQSSMSGEMAFSSSSSLEPLAVLVAASSGRILLAWRLLSRAVSARRRVWAMFSMTLPPVSSDRWGLRAARCFRARLLSACGWVGTRCKIQKTVYQTWDTGYRLRTTDHGLRAVGHGMQDAGCSRERIRHCHAALASYGYSPPVSSKCAQTETKTETGRETEASPSQHCRLWICASNIHSTRLGEIRF